MRDLSTLPAYLINLDCNTERLASSVQSIEMAGLPFSRIPAVDGRGLDLNSLPDCDPEAALRLYGRPLKGGEYGCYKSHLACAERMLEEGHAAALVFEDDMILGPGFQDHLIAALAWLEQSGTDWHMVNLGAPGTRIFTPLADLGAGHRLVAAHYFPQTAHPVEQGRSRRFCARSFLRQDDRGQSLSSRDGPFWQRVCGRAAVGGYDRRRVSHRRRPSVQPLRRAALEFWPSQTKAVLGEPGYLGLSQTSVSVACAVIHYRFGPDCAAFNAGRFLP